MSLIMVFGCEGNLFSEDSCNNFYIFDTMFSFDNNLFNIYVKPQNLLFVNQHVTEFYAFINLYTCMTKRF